MGVSAADSYPEAFAVFEQASELAGYDILKLCDEGPLDKLSKTIFTQPALYTVEAALTDVLRARGVEPIAAAGHSLGEFSAWYAAGVYSFEDGFKLVSERGRLMDSADPDGRGTMAAVIGLSPDVVFDVCSEVDGQVVIANDNSPLQQVISGEKAAVDIACDVLSERGAKRIVPLKVSGAFHSPLMENARDAFEEAVEDIGIFNAVLPVYANTTAAPVTDEEDIRQCMVQQMISSVKWTETILNIAAHVNDRYAEKTVDILEIGPGKILAGLIKRIDRSLTVHSVSDASGIEEVI